MANFIYLTNGFRLTCRVSTPYLLRSKRTDMVRTWYGGGTAHVQEEGCPKSGSPKKWKSRSFMEKRQLFFLYNTGSVPALRLHT